MLYSVEEHNLMIYNSWNLKVNNKVFHMDLNHNLNEIIVHHYLVNKMRLNCSYEVKATLREIEYKTNLGIQKVRTALNKLESLGIVEITRGAGKKPNVYKYIME